MQVNLLTLRDPWGTPLRRRWLSFLSRGVFAHLPGWWDLRGGCVCAFVLVCLGAFPGGSLSLLGATGGVDRRILVHHDGRGDAL